MARFLSCKRGTAAIEFAIVANIFIALLTGIVGAGYIYVVRSDMENSLAAAERYALVHEEDDAALQSLIRSALATYRGENISMTVSRGSSSGIDFVKVELTYAIDAGVSSIGPLSISMSRIFPT